MAAQKLSDAEISSRLARLTGWSLREGKLHADFQFKNFSQAFAFMTRVALAAEAMDHHPDWSNVWNKVAIDLCTHSAGGITDRDFTLAEKIQALAGG